MSTFKLWKVFKSSRTEKTYPLRHNFTCTSKNVIYLITCTKCKKQYVGLTTQQLNTRINHHRTNIFNRVQTYISNHFNFPDHSITNLTVQIIDKPQDDPNSFFELQRLERHWIITLKRVQPFGLKLMLVLEESLMYAIINLQQKCYYCQNNNIFCIEKTKGNRTTHRGGGPIPPPLWVFLLHTHTHTHTHK